MRRLVLFLLAIALASGCMVGPKFKKTEWTTEARYRYTLDTTSKDSITSLKWWEVYQDTVLQSLIRTALVENRDMQIALSRLMEAQYNVLRKNGHTPSEAFNETVEELTQSLIRLVGENGMDWMYANCSATAQRGALDWKPKFRKAVKPVFDELYKRVANGAETKRVLQSCGRPDYQQQLTKELNTMANSELWLAGKATRALRPKEQAKKFIATAKGTFGRASN